MSANCPNSSSLFRQRIFVEAALRTDNPFAALDEALREVEPAAAGLGLAAADPPRGWLVSPEDPSLRSELRQAWSRAEQLLATNIPQAETVPPRAGQRPGTRMKIMVLPLPAAKAAEAVWIVGWPENKATASCLRESATLGWWAFTAGSGLRRAATRDALTGCINRAGGRRRLDEILSLTRHGVTPCCVVWLDIDGFKAVNDRLGHPAGDTLLAAFADRLRRNIRKSDLLVRYGGDEFLLILPGADPRSARRLLERLRDITEDQPIQAGERHTVITFSAGVVPVNEFDSPRDIMAAADRALQKDKRMRKSKR